MPNWTNPSRGRSTRRRSSELDRHSSLRLLVRPPTSARSPHGTVEPVCWTQRGAWSPADAERAQADRSPDNPERDREFQEMHANLQFAMHRRRWGNRFRERLRISSSCLTSSDSATTERTPPGPTSRATVVSRWRNRTVKSRTETILARSLLRRKYSGISQFATHRQPFLDRDAELDSRRTTLPVRWNPNSS